MVDFRRPGIYKQYTDEFPATGTREIETKRLEPAARGTHIRGVCTASSAAASSAAAALRAACCRLTRRFVTSKVSPRSLSCFGFGTVFFLRPPEVALAALNVQVAPTSVSCPPGVNKLDSANSSKTFCRALISAAVVAFSKGKKAFCWRNLSLVHSLQPIAL